MHSWFMGSHQRISVIRTLGEVDSSLHGWLWGVQDFRGRGLCGSGGDSKRARIRSGAWGWDGPAADSGYSLNAWRVAADQWAEKVVCGGAAKTVGMTTEGLESRISLVDRAASGFGRFVWRHDFESCVGKSYQRALQATQKVSWREESVDAPDFIVALRSDHSHPDLQQPPPCSVSSHHRQKDFELQKAQMIAFC